MQDLTEAELAELDRLQCDALRENQRDRKIILYDQYYDQYGYATSAISTYVNLLLGLTPRLVAEVRRLRAENAELRNRVETLATFKAYVHRRLDEAGVPVDPDSPHRAHGCRIGGRLDIALINWM